jgi:hypothetical protein
LDSAAVAPECLLWLPELGEYASRGDESIWPPGANDIENCFASLLPLSWWSLRTDFRNSGIPIDVKPFPPGTPFGDVAKMIGIAERFEQLGIDELAWKAGDLRWSSSKLDIS